MKKAVLRTGIALAVIAAFVALVVVFISRLGSQTLYAGHDAEYWKKELSSRDVNASNRAAEIVTHQIVPQLVHQMFCDTNGDSALRLGMIEFLNGIPGVHIDFKEAWLRRWTAASQLGEFGQAATGAVPALIRVVRGQDEPVRTAAIDSLGNLRSDPDLVIPLLIECLDKRRLDGPAATALGNFGSLSRAAMPKLLRLTKSLDKDARNAAIDAVKKVGLNGGEEAAATPDRR